MAVRSVDEAAHEDYYDLSVPGHDNYLAEGMWHHNSGKTRAVCEWLAGKVAGDGPDDESAIVAPTFGDARDVDVEGQSGLLAALRRREVPVRSWNRSMGELWLGNGARVMIDGADDGALRVQGHGLRRALCDEVRNWRPGYAEQAWDESLLPAVTAGGDPQIVAASTPGNTPLMRRLLADPDADIRHMRIWDNSANLGGRALEELRRRYEGTRLGRQELDGEMIDDVEGALWRRAWIDDQRVASVGVQTTRVVVGVDPAEGAGSSEQALVVAALGDDHQIYILGSVAVREPVAAFAARCVRTAARFDAELVVERNHGGQWMRQVLDGAMRTLGVIVAARGVYSSQGKRVRAEPVAALYETGRVSHVGAHPQLEDQLCGFVETGDPSDLLDAAVFAVGDLARGTGGGGPDAVPWDARGEGAVPWAVA